MTKRSLGIYPATDPRQTYSNEETSDLASSMIGDTFNFLSEAHAIAGQARGLFPAESEEEGSLPLDATPIVAGAIGGIMAFCMSGEATDADLREMLVEMIDGILPQIRIQYEAKKLDEAIANDYAALLSRITELEAEPDWKARALKAEGERDEAWRALAEIVGVTERAVERLNV